MTNYFISCSYIVVVTVDYTGREGPRDVVSIIFEFLMNILSNFPYHSKSMHLIWQVMAHTWNRYGMVKPLYATDIVPSFVKFQRMGRV